MTGLDCGVSWWRRRKTRAWRGGRNHRFIGWRGGRGRRRRRFRRAIDHWFDHSSLRPRVVAEFEDSALLKVFGQHGEGLFVAPSVIEEDIINSHRVEVVGRLAEVKERFYAITVERRIKHPAVVAIREAAKHQLFRREPGMRSGSGKRRKALKR